MFYLKNMRANVGHCNICGKKAPLSWDHVPPKGGIELTPVEQETVFQRLVARPEDSLKYFESQNGVKYRSICADCNSTLGHSFDPVLNEFAISIGRMLRTSSALPAVVHVNTKPNRLVRAIFGHLLAAKGEFEDTIPDRLMREAVCNPSDSVSAELNVHYWIHPYPNIVVMRDVGMLAVRGIFKEKALFSILKYFPIAYAVTALDSYEGLPTLSRFLSCDIDQENDIPIDLRNTKHTDWPEIVEPDNVLFGGQSIKSSVSAIPRDRGNKKMTNQGL